MATSLLVVTDVVAASGWTGATAGNLNSSNDARATGGDPVETIEANITNAPADYDSGNTVTLKAEWRLNGTANRPKNLLVELRSSDLATLHATFTTPGVTSQSTDRTDTSSALTLNLSKTDLDNAKLLVTVQEGGGMPDSATVEIDYLEVSLDYNPVVNDRKGEVSWAEFETPNAPRKAEVSWVELESPNAPRKAELSWTELEVPTAPRKGEISWAEFEVPNAPRKGEVSWAELETPNVPRKAEVSWSEFETPTAPRKAEVSFAELETPDVPVRAEVSWAEFQVPNANVVIKYLTVVQDIDNI